MTITLLMSSVCPCVPMSYIFWYRTTIKTLRVTFLCEVIISYHTHAASHTGSTVSLSPRLPNFVFIKKINRRENKKGFFAWLAPSHSTRWIMYQAIIHQWEQELIKAKMALQMKTRCTQMRFELNKQVSRPGNSVHSVVFPRSHHCSHSHNVFD